MTTLRTPTLLSMDFAGKSAEAIRQSLIYAVQTGKKAGIMLVLKGRVDDKYLERPRQIVSHYSMDVEIFPNSAL